MSHDPSQTNSPKSPLSRRTFLKGLGGWLSSHWLLSGTLLSSGGLAAWARHDTLTLKKEVWDLYYPRLPKPLEGITLVQLSDVHLKTLSIPLKEIVKAVQSLAPDLIVLTGDLVDTTSDILQAEEFLRALKAPHGCYFCLGNNDYAHFSKTLLNRYLRLIKNSGWQPLLNDSVYLDDLKLWIIGIDDPATARDDVSLAYSRLITTPDAVPVLAGGVASPTEDEHPPFHLVLAHSTDCLDEVIRYGAELFLSGHTHGGQIRLPGRNPIVNNTLLGTQGIYEGFHLIEGIPTYINRGIGTSILPVRFNSLPEIAAFCLHRGRPEDQGFAYKRHS